MMFPDYRPRRLRQNSAFRRLVRETVLTVNDLIYPIFVVPGKKVKEPIESMPGQFRYSVDYLPQVAKEVYNLGIPGIIVFGIPSSKDAFGTGAYAEKGIVQQAVRRLKQAAPELAIITDVCLCQYTDHGHCGVIEKETVDNDATLDLLAKTAVSHAKAGADMVAPSDMMDGRVAEIRGALDENGFDQLPIMAYSAKYCSAYYGPFREAAESAPQFGDRRTYQMDPANGVEAVREAMLDVEEGADIIMVKPGLPYLDVLYRLREEFDLPLAVYNVSGEYAMVKAAEKMGWIDGDRVMMETLTAFKRAGADMILTYFAVDAAKVMAS